MGKKKRKHADIEDVLHRPWCYYCERDFEDLKLLISHQKAKHFKCDECGRRLNTAGGLSVHMNQVHKETLSQVENALPNRSGLDVEIFGMEGIPQEALEQHRNRIIQNFYQEQEDRRVATGNPLPGGQAAGSPRKKIKYETAEEIKARLAEWRKRRAAGENGAAAAAPAPAPAGGAHPYPPAQGQYPEAQTVPPGAPPGAPPAYPQPGFSGYPQQAPPGPPPAPTGLPQRPPGAGPYWSGAGAPSTVDELVSGAATGQGQGQGGDDIDQMIRMAEAGVRPPGEAAPAEKKGKKEKVRMFYDGEVSPEERMAKLPRYALVQ